MFSHAALPLLLLFFALAAGAVWFAGGRLAKTTDAIAERLHLGHTLCGLLLLAVATNLPELAITIAAAREGRRDLISGSLLGSIAAQTAVLAVIDGVVYRKDEPLTFRAGSLELVLEGVLVMAMLSVIVMATQVPPMMIGHFTTPSGFLILVGWGVGIALLNKARHGLPWEPAGDRPTKPAKAEGAAVRHPFPIFIAAALATLLAGVVLEQTSSAIAERLHIGGLVFGATVLAAAGALPELSSCLGAVRAGNDRLAVSDVLGGHVFLPVLFVVATAVSGRSILSGAERGDVFLTALGILLTAVFVYGLIFRPRRQFLRLGIDSLVVLLLYAGGIAGLAALTR